MLYIESPQVRRALEIQMEMCDAINSVGIFNDLIKQNAHKLAAIVEHTRKPVPNTDGDTRLNTRMTIGLTSHNPMISIMNGRLFISTEGYYEIPDMQAVDFGSAAIRPGVMHPEWAQYCRISRLVDSANGTFSLINMGDGQKTIPKQIMVLFGDEVPLFANVLYRRMQQDARRDFGLLNQQLSSLKNECPANMAATGA